VQGVFGKNELLSKHMARGPQRRRAQCSRFGCIGLRPALLTKLILNGEVLDLEQGYSIILRKGPVTNIKIFRDPVTPIKSCKC